MEYDPNNIFARIIRGELPSHKVFEDDDIFVMMDIMPAVPGHVLVLPKSAARNILDVPDDVLSRLILGVRRIAVAAKAAMGAEGVAVEQFNEAAGGQTVFHLHFHVVPRWSGVLPLMHGRQAEKPEVLAEQAEQIRRAIV